MINIVGSGLAGLSAAIALAQQGRPCSIISIQESQRAQSVMAEGGINAALNTMGEDDDVSQHYEDTMKGGAYLADPRAVKDLTGNAPEIVEWLKTIGVPFEIKNGKIVQRNFGGQKKKRTAYVKSSTGKMLMSALIDEARKYEIQGLIHRYDHHMVYDLIIENKKCKGLKMTDTYNGKTYEADGPVILACGGLTGFFAGHTTGSSDNTGQLTADLFVKGVRLANLEMIQYHPTTVEISGKRLLVSEAARGEGGRFMTYRNGKPYYFMEELYPEEKNLVTRDVATRAVDKIMKDEECSGDVYLDMRKVDKDVWKNKLSDMRKELKDYFKIDIAKEPFRIMPGIHYFMGGIYVDKDHRTNIDDLYAAGECACIYHGANRLGGNSLLGAIYGGRTAASKIRDDSEEKITEINDDPSALQIQPFYAARLVYELSEGLGIIRDKESLDKALANVEKMLKEDRNAEEKNMTLMAKAMLLSALARKESRGAHYRQDYPESSDEYRKNTIAYYDNEIHIEFEDIGK